MHTHMHIYRSVAARDFPLVSMRDLPQVADDEEMMIELLQDVSQRTHAEIAAELHHQIDPSYQ